MGDQIVLLVLGFVLTSVAGGLLGHYLQRRTWESNRKETERQAAVALFNDISRAMDRRFYRMWLLHWKLKAGDESAIEKALNDYRVVLEEWNDSLNRNLALAYRYFGESSWRYLDKAIYEEFARLGKLLEDCYNERRDPKPRISIQSLRQQLKALSDEVYLLNRFFASLIQHGRVGLYQSEKHWPERPPWEGDLKRGSEGPRVAEWQRELNLVVVNQVLVDGRFGVATHEATVGFQGNAGVEADGIVDGQTRKRMEELLPDFVAPNW